MHSGLFKSTKYFSFFSYDLFIVFCQQVTLKIPRKVLNYLLILIVSFRLTAENIL
jgi:hypothetical protein